METEQYFRQKNDILIFFFLFSSFCVFQKLIFVQQNWSFCFIDLSVILIWNTIPVRLSLASISSQV